MYDIPLTTLSGEPTTLASYRGQTLLAVNVASRCGYTPQYRELAELHHRYAPLGFSVLGFPCNQFLFQEPGQPADIEACAAGFGADFPLFGKLRVNGRRRHPLFALLTATPDGAGRAGRVRWNFEKFLIGRDGRPVLRFRTATKPDDPSLITAVESALV